MTPYSIPSALSIVILSSLLLTIFSCAPRYKGPITDHFDGKKFFNPGMPERSSGGVLKWLLHRDKGPWPEQPDAFIGARPATRIEGDSLVLTFVNHSTFLIQTAGLNILTDPVWSERVGPTSWLGIKRKRPPGLRLDELPPIDVVLLSHNHYDHLDLPTIKKLVKAFDPLFVTPLGVSYLPKLVDGRTTRELDWDDTLRINDKLSLSCTQAQHFSNRGIGDREETLWCGYLLHTSFGTTYFCGDSGYGPHFKKIAEQARQSATGPIKLALLPIGSYRPEWFMAPVHVSPAGAVQAFLDLNQPQSVGIHFGTFQQGDDGLFEPADDLRKALQASKISEDKFLVPKEGHPMVFK
ncbi:twin-arginine translocation pathway signal [Spirosoma pollinicola]|uniref:Twin-arginine translocation pathway signal n=1 Tax=Spirosoma pollinicola TaxID=2057025 RepID=A0A2K8YTU0_9BACT|nr:MBL fold metallo-hydrolase [Spirosoma pollinicola]AUD01055.1 twin-arginine translocation pathway signal [Spirosoma pollinicola]